MTSPDDPVLRRRALAARVASLAGYNEERLGHIIIGCQRLHCAIPSTVVNFPAELRRFADSIERTRP
ncbi:MAG TPA: hypothetical protein VK942_11360 [Actinomycetes bacterium]|nr:hypothetical protein [Actinomycetes bacterium]